MTTQPDWSEYLTQMTHLLDMGWMRRAVRSWSASLPASPPWRSR